jgi:hypothetical protein
MSFDFRDYVRVESDDAEFKQQIEQFLEQMAQTPEGRKILEEVREGNNGVRVSIIGDTRPRMPAGFEGEKEEVEKFARDTGADPATGRITIAKDELSTLRYKDTNGQWQQVSLGSAIYHELYHMRDPEALAKKGVSLSQLAQLPDAETPQQLAQRMQDAQTAAARDVSGNPNMTFEEAKKYITDLGQTGDEKYSDVMNRIMGYQQSSSPAERKAVEATNAFMQKYYGESPRGNYQDTDKQGTPELETYAAIRRPGSPGPG